MQPVMKATEWCCITVLQDSLTLFLENEMKILEMVCLKRMLHIYKSRNIAVVIQIQDIGVNRGVKTCDFFLCFLPLLSCTILHSIVSVHFVFFVLRHLHRGRAGY